MIKIVECRHIVYSLYQQQLIPLYNLVSFPSKRTIPSPINPSKVNKQPTHNSHTPTSKRNIHIPKEQLSFLRSNSVRSEWCDELVEFIHDEWVVARIPIEDNVPEDEGYLVDEVSVSWKG